MDIRLIKAMVIGDGSLSIKKANARLRIMHSIKQKDYLLWKRDLLSASGVTTWYGECKNLVNPYTGKRAMMCWVESASYPELTVLRDLLYPKDEGFKPGVLGDLEALHLAIIFMDDGCRQVCKTVTMGRGKKAEVHPYIGSYQIALQSHGFGGVHQFKEWLHLKFGIHSAVWTQKGKPKIGICRKSEKTKFREILSPYVHPSLSYKLDGTFEAHVICRERLSEKASSDGEEPEGMMRQSELAGTEPREGEPKSLPASTKAGHEK